MLPIQIGQAKTQQPLLRQKPTSFVCDFDYTLALYGGCYYQCLYCYVPAVQNHYPDRRGGWGNYVDLRSQGVDLLKRQAEKLKGARLFMSATTDPYQPVGAKERLTRRVLETLADIPFDFLLISTRSGLVLRDLDLFTDPRLQGRIEVGISIPSDLPAIHERLEPRTASFCGRFAIARRLKEAQVPTRIQAAPLAIHSPDFASEAIANAHWLWFDKAAHGARTTEPSASLLRDAATVQISVRQASTLFGVQRVGYGREQFAWRWDKQKQQIVPPSARITANNEEPE